MTAQDVEMKKLQELKHLNSTVQSNRKHEKRRHLREVVVKPALLLLEMVAFTKGREAKLEVTHHDIRY